MTEREHAVPRVVLSRCLELEACRYNARLIRSGVVRLMAPFVDFVPVCPEVEIGLGVPRDPIRLVAGPAGDPGPGALRLVQPSTGRDLTERMTGFGHGFADRVAEVDGLLLKSRSPSCGVADAKVHAGADDARAEGEGAGMFAAILMERYPLAAVEDEARLTDASIRHHFLTRIFGSAALREALAEGPAALADLHARYKLVLMAHSPARQRELGRLVAEVGPAAGERYRAGFAEALREPATRGGHINAIQHAQGYFKRELGGREKRRFLELQARYREGRLPIQALLEVLGSWVARFDEPYLRRQAYFRPYPAPLLAAAGSGRARPA